MTNRRPIHSTSSSAEVPPEPIARIERAVRSTVRTAGPTLRPVVKWGAPWLTGKDLVVAVRGFAHHVGVEFWRGTSLPDPTRLLEGTGKNLRHVKIRSLAEARSGAFRNLVAAAVRLDARAPPRVR